MRKILAGFVLSAIFLFASSAIAVEINGTVREARGNTATIVTQSDLLPNVGDRVEIFFKMPGTDDEISIGSGQVSEVGAESVKIKVEKATGSLDRDQLARIFSDNPRKRGTPPTAVSQPATPPMTTAKLSVDRNPAFEYDTDRPGGNYRNFALYPADPQLCAAQCAQESQCRAWTSVIPGVQGQSARCWLKDRVPNPVPNARFAVSGVVARPGDSPAAPPPQAATGGPYYPSPPQATYPVPPAATAQKPAYLDGTDIKGPILRFFGLNEARVEACAQACAADANCGAYTYVKPGAYNAGDAPMCYLKSRVEATMANHRVISGITRGDYAGPSAAQGAGVGISPATGGPYYPLSPQTTQPIPPVRVAQNPAYEYDTDRPGSDYRNFALSTAEPGICAAQCAQESQCRAWTYVIPGIQGPNARCWLKDRIPNPVVNARFAVSGVTRPGIPAAPPPPSSSNNPMFEFNTDRPGSDYRNFELSVADPGACAAQCGIEGQCQAWTYVKPGVQGRLARCWLKNRVPAAVIADFAVSGVRAGGSPQAGSLGSFAGRWNSRSNGIVTFTQDGNRASATYSSPGGTFTGTVQGRVLQGEGANNVGGFRYKLRLELTPDGNSFNGTVDGPGWSGKMDGTRAN